MSVEAQMRFTSPDRREDPNWPAFCALVESAKSCSDFSTSRRLLAPLTLWLTNYKGVIIFNKNFRSLGRSLAVDTICATVLVSFQSICQTAQHSTHRYTAPPAACRTPIQHSSRNYVSVWAHKLRELDTDRPQIGHEIAAWSQMNVSSPPLRLLSSPPLLKSLHCLHGCGHKSCPGGALLMRNVLVDVGLLLLLLLLLCTGAVRRSLIIALRLIIVSANYYERDLQIVCSRCSTS